MEIDYMECNRIVSSIEENDKEKELKIRNTIIQGKEHVLITEDGIAIYKLEYDQVKESYYLIFSKTQK